MRECVSIPPPALSLYHVTICGRVSVCVGSLSLRLFFSTYPNQKRTRLVSGNCGFKRTNSIRSPVRSLAQRALPLSQFSRFVSASPLGWLFSLGNDATTQRRNDTTHRALSHAPTRVTTHNVLDGPELPAPFARPPLDDDAKTAPRTAHTQHPTRRRNRNSRRPL